MYVLLEEVPKVEMFGASVRYTSKDAFYPRDNIGAVRMMLSFLGDISTALQTARSSALWTVWQLPRRGPAKSCWGNPGKCTPYPAFRVPACLSPDP